MSDTNEHSLSLSYQIRRAIKAEDALRTAKQEVANLNELLNASYVDPTGKSGLSALLKKVFWPSKLDKEILELVASQAIELEELGKEVNCIPDMREEIVYLKAQIAAKQAQPERGPSDDTARLNWLEAHGLPGLGWVARDSTTGRGYRLHQDSAGHVLVRDAIDAAIKQGGQHD